MKNTKILKLDIFKVLLIFFTGLIVFVFITLINYDTTISLNKDGVAKLEALSSNIQRISKFELENNKDDNLINEVDVICSELTTIDDGEEQYFEKSDEITAIVNDMVNDWNDFKEIVYDYRLDESGNRDMLFSASEQNYSKSSDRMKFVNDHMNEYSAERDTIQNVLVANFVCIALLLVKILMNTHKELEENKKLSEGMFIDTATGIYNRSKCQEIMKTPPLLADNKKNRAVVIFDLNDLKKTNDSLGHRAGDELIFDFAQQVKKATDTFENDIFVGRYGGDEFVAFLDEIMEQDVLDYIEEVRNLMTKFNETENKGYNLSSAIGYGITTDDTKTMTVKELFDVADGDMYENKIAMKEKKRQELIAQGVEVPDEVDDRL